MGRLSDVALDAMNAHNTAIDTAIDSLSVPDSTQTEGDNVAK
jgi:hypothetical protein